MEEKLRSILKQIPWSLTFKAGAFTLSFWLLPYWAFVLVAAYLYLSPLFRSGVMVLPFLFALALAAIAPEGFLAAFFLGTIFFLILGVKGLTFVDRASVYEVIVLLIYFAVLILGFKRFDYGLTLSAFVWFGFIHAAFFFLARGFFVQSYPDLFAARARTANLFLAIGVFLLWEVSAAMLFMPANFLSQTAILFLVGAIFLEFTHDCLRSTLTRRKTLFYFSIFFAFAALTLAGVDFGL